jgi:hypothetical protein
MILWWQRTHAHEFLGADLDDLNAQVVVEMRNDFVGHVMDPTLPVAAPLHNPLRHLV